MEPALRFAALEQGGDGKADPKGEDDFEQWIQITVGRIRDHGGKS
jgi:hypothetical protein